MQLRHRRWVGFAAFALALGGAHATHPTPQIVLVQPSARQVPANLLRISVRFSAPVEGPVLTRVTLLRADGTPIQEPFLQQELWSPDGTVLTFLMHPGRVKTGLNARDEVGPILLAGDDVVLALDGRPIKRWIVGPADANGPVASAWKLSPIRVASKQPLVVALDGPIDGRGADYLAIVDGRNRLVEGRARLKNGECTWTFTPHRAWQEGKYKLVVRRTLEDPAGNRLGGHFERPMNLPLEPATDAEIAFEAASSASSTAPQQRSGIGAEAGESMPRKRLCLHDGTLQVQFGSNDLT